MSLLSHDEYFIGLIGNTMGATHVELHISECLDDTKLLEERVVVAVVPTIPPKALLHAHN